MKRSQFPEDTHQQLYRAYIMDYQINVVVSRPKTRIAIFFQMRFMKNLGTPIGS